jgi:hypothetical protein
MKFTKQLIISCVLGIALGATSGLVKAEQNLKDFNPEPFKVVCVKNKLYVVWEHRELVIQVKGIFCSDDEDIVKLLKPKMVLPVVTNICRDSEHSLKYVYNSTIATTKEKLK